MKLVSTNHFSSKTRKSILDHNALIFKKTFLFCDDNFFDLFQTFIENELKDIFRWIHYGYTNGAKKEQ